jgi:RimJ/RimL family protein N-acetyltransferase
MNPILRIANLDDLPTLLEFEQQLIKAERPMDPSIKDGNISYYDISEMIKAANSEVFVVELDDEIVASGYAKIIDDRHYMKHKKQGYLGFMFVPEEHRGKGLNKLILKTLIDWCKTRNVFEIRLDVYDVNETAIKAYKKSGFKNYLINMRFDIEY